MLATTDSTKAAFHNLLARSMLTNDDTLQISQVVPTCGGSASAADAGTCTARRQHGNAEIVHRFYTLSIPENMGGSSRSTRSVFPYFVMLP